MIGGTLLVALGAGVAVTVLFVLWVGRSVSARPTGAEAGGPNGGQALDPGVDVGGTPVTVQCRNCDCENAVSFRYCSHCLTVLPGPVED